MGRKNLIGLAEPANAPELSPDNTAAPVLLDRPIAGLARSTRPSAPVGGITKSLNNITQQIEDAKELERRLVEGQVVVELDPAIIDASFVADRLEVDPGHQTSLVAQIREHGQQVPILVRPHPEKAGRYQVAYGHRRLAAVKAVGIKVRAVIRELTDEQLVVSQGQENNARTDLSFIERAYFAVRLEQKGFARNTIMAALGVDKAALSKMISLVARLPGELIEAVGPAPFFGRRRWVALADLLEPRGQAQKASALIATGDFQTLTSDERFQKLYDHLAPVSEKPQTESWATSTGVRPVTIKDTATAFTLSFDKRVAPAFGPFVRQRLQALFDEFEHQTGD